ncbi:MAG TPA: GGDEF domain-containing protein [Thermoanaerobaculia bacterium]|nr:GGDEF domain-containing protein [Thermoanaerobaculia bacterium]
MLPLWAELLLLAVAVTATVRAYRVARRERFLAARLQARERESHFLGESPEPARILEHAFAAAAEILPLTSFDLYRVDRTERIYEVWSLPPGGEPGVPRKPVVDPNHPYLRERIDSKALLRFAATETERSFAPSELLPGTAPTQRLHLPLYSGDALVAYLSLVSPEEIDERRKGDLRALLAPLTASLQASRNWEIAVTDELSGLFARRYLETRYAEEWARAMRYGTSLSVALFDLDHFKRVNDTLGHAAGDVAIRRFGAILRAAVRASDVAARYGGEEFAAIFPETAARSALGVADRVRRAFEKEDFESGRRAFHATVSCGVADAAGLGPDDRDQLLFRADQALYRAKDEGRNRVRLWSEKKSAAARER